VTCLVLSLCYIVLRLRHGVDMVCTCPCALWYMVACFLVVYGGMLSSLVALSLVLYRGIFSYASRAVCLMASCVSGGVMSGKSSKVCGLASWSCLQDMCVLPATQVCLVCNTGVSCLQHMCVMSPISPAVMCVVIQSYAIISIVCHTPSFP